MPSDSANTAAAPGLAILGTGSDVGKSIVVTALCRLFHQAGIASAPFKTQNMSNNSGVTVEGLEMGRAQIVQAGAAGAAPSVLMNPILLKPTSEIGAQVVLNGKSLQNFSAREYHREKSRFVASARKALATLRTQYEVVVIEGAGSCAEVNLMANDIVNFQTAIWADAPVIVVADIHRGGVFAQIVGTLECLATRHRDRIAGFIINRFRGDLSLFDDGVQWLEARTGKKCFGVLPYFIDFKIESEDAVVLEQPPAAPSGNLPGANIGIVRLPHISNFTDFDPLSEISGLHVFFIEKPDQIDRLDAIILPGSKNTCHDLNWLHENGWTEELKRYAAGHGAILGICGGYQMMGRYVDDPLGLEGRPGKTGGLALLPVTTVLKAPKVTTRTGFTWGDDRGAGYEIHMGETILEGGQPVFGVMERNGHACMSSEKDGCLVGDGRIMGTYIHGLFDTTAILKHWLDQTGLEQLALPRISRHQARENAYDRLADHFRTHIDLEAINALFPEGPFLPPGKNT